MTVVVIILINLLMFEGLTLATFPDRVLELLQWAGPRALQVAGLVELAVGVGLLAALWQGPF